MDIEGHLDRAHKAMGRAGFLVVTMIVKRRLWRSNLVEAVEQLKYARNELEGLLEGQKGDQ